jgi:AraC-like DNA-binding protein
VTLRQSFKDWHLPKELDGVLLLEDRRNGSGSMATRELHAHDELELHFLERGKATFSFPSSQLVAEAGTLVWVPPGREHLLQSSSSDLMRWVLLCRRRLVQRVLPHGAGGALLTRSAKEQSKRLPRPAFAALRQTFSDVQSDGGRELPVVNAGVAFALARAWLHFQAANTHPEPAAVHPAVAAAVRLLREHGERPSMRELAEGSGVTESHLSKLFVSEVGITITEFRNRIGVERFLELYGDGSGLTLLDAALDAGFGSYPQFYRIFTKHMGYPPAEHRARVRVGREAGRS